MDLEGKTALYLSPGILGLKAMNDCLYARGNVTVRVPEGQDTDSTVHTVHRQSKMVGGIVCVSLCCVPSLVLAQFHIATVFTQCVRSYNTHVAEKLRHLEG